MLRHDKMLSERYCYLTHAQDQNHQPVQKRQPVKMYDTLTEYQQNKKWDSDCKADSTDTHTTAHGHMILITVHTVDTHSNTKYEKSTSADHRHSYDHMSIQYKHSNTKIEQDVHNHRDQLGAAADHLHNCYHAVQYRIGMDPWTANNLRQYQDIDIVGRIVRSHFYGSRLAMDTARWTTA